MSKNIREENIREEINVKKILKESAMSLMYKIEVKENVKIHVDVHDEIIHQIRLQQILSKEEMINIFVEELEKQGFLCEEAELPPCDRGSQHSESKKIWVRRDEQLQEVQVFDPQNMKLSASIDQSREKEQVIVKQGRGDLDFKTKGEIRQQTLEMIEEERQILEKDLEEQVQGEVTQRLQENSSQRNAQIQDALQRTYGRALKERAKTLGQVVEQHESEENGIYELKITIEL